MPGCVFGVAGCLRAFVAGCVVGAVMCVCTGSWCDGMCLRWSCRVCGLCLCSLASNRIGAPGAVAIGAGLAHVPQLQTLKYVVCPVVCAGPRCELAWERGAMACGVVVCAACARAALDTTVLVTRVRRALVQAWSTCPSCRRWGKL
jgi:hypothetical protein